MRQCKWKRSMSRKSHSPDNSACAGFFGRLKNGYSITTTTGTPPWPSSKRPWRYIEWHDATRTKRPGFQKPRPTPSFTRPDSIKQSKYNNVYNFPTAPPVCCVGWWGRYCWRRCWFVGMGGLWRGGSHG